MNISEKLKSCRNNSCLTQSQVAESLYVSRKTISGWENDRSCPDIKSFVKLSDLYKVSLDSLVPNDKVLNYYQQQSRKNTKIRKIAKYSYIFNVVLLGACYIELFRIAGIHSLLIPLLLLINIITFYSHYENRNKTKEKKRFLKTIIIFILFFGVNVLLSFINQDFVYQIRNNGISFITGMMLGRFILIFMMSLSLIIAIFCTDIFKSQKNFNMSN